jgi:hypothetical protein
VTAKPALVVRSQMVYWPEPIQSSRMACITTSASGGVSGSPYCVSVRMMVSASAPL